MKDHLESLKCLRRSMAPKPGTVSFFGRAAPSTPRVGVATSEEEAGGRDSTPTNQEAETDLSRRERTSPRNKDNRFCTHKHVYAIPLLHVLPEMQMFYPYSVTTFQKAQSHISTVVVCM